MNKFAEDAQNQRAHFFEQTASRLTPLLLVAVGCVMTLPRVASAQVSLPTVNLGDTNFEDGIAGAGLLVEEFPGYYTASAIKNAYGNTSEGRNRVISISTTTHIAFVSKKHLWGGLYGAEILLPLVDLDVELANSISNRVRGFGDLTVSPLILQWVPRKIGRAVIAQRAVFDVILPTGTYSDRRPVNIGSHSVSLNPYYSATYAPHSNFEASLRFHYLWNSENNQPFAGLGFKRTQAGQAFHANYATSYAVWKGVRLGFNGYWLQQITDHNADGTDLPNSRERTIGLGPGVQFGGQGVWFRVSSYFETGVQNRPSGIKVTLRVSKTV